MVIILSHTHTFIVLLSPQYSRVRVMNVSFLSVTSKVSSGGANSAEPPHFLGSYSEANSSAIIHRPFGCCFKCNQTGPHCPAAPGWTRPSRGGEEDACTDVCCSARFCIAFLASVANPGLQTKASM